MYIDVETSAGVRVGDGPITTARDWETVSCLDKAGTFTFNMPAADPRAVLIQPKRIVRAYRIIAGVVTEIGAGIVDSISYKSDNTGGVDLEVSGDDLMRELTYSHVGKLEIGTEAVPATTGPANIAAFFPTGWTLDTTNGYNATLKAIYHKYEGESCLAALGKLAELTGEHFRLGVGRKVIWMQNDRPDSGVRAIQGGEPVALESNADICIIDNQLEQTQDTYDSYTGRIYGYGVGDGDKRVHFRDAVNNHAAEGYAISSDALGWFLEHTATWNAYHIRRYMSFKDVNNATTLAEQAYEWMSRRLSPQQAYKLNVKKLDRAITVGSTLRVIYKRIVDGSAIFDVDADLVVLEARTSSDAKGSRTVDLKVATTDAWPDNDTSATVDGLSQSQNFYTHSQGFASTTDIWSAIAEALNQIILRPADGDPCSFYDGDSAGLGSALLAATSGDEIIGPYAHPIALTAGIATPAGVRFYGLNLSFVCGGDAVTADDYQEWKHCRITQDGTGESTARAFVADGLIDVKIVDCAISASAATNNVGAYGVGHHEDHGPEFKNCWLQAFYGALSQSLVLGDYAEATQCYCGGDFATNNVGVLLYGTQSGNAGPKLIDTWAGVTGNPAVRDQIACQVTGTGMALGSHFIGSDVGLQVDAGSTLQIYGCYWSSLVNDGTITYLTGDRSPIDHTHTRLSAWYNVRDYGAVGDGVTDDTSAIDGALAAVEAVGGGVLYFPKGNYLTTGNHSLDAAITVLGDGASTYFDEDVELTAVTVITCTSATNVLFIANSFGCNFRDFVARCTAASPTAGAAIRLNEGDLVHMQNLSIMSFYDDIYVADGAEWFMDGVYIYEPVRYGLYGAHTDFSGDFGDTHISNCSFYPGDRDSEAAIYITSGGGWKLSNIKVNGWYAPPPTGHAFRDGIFINVDASVSTVNFQLVNSSIENTRETGIKMRSGTAPSRWRYINLAGLEFGMYTSSGAAIDIVSATDGDFSYITMAGIVVYGPTPASSGAAIELTRVQHATLVAIKQSNYAHTVTESSCTDVTFIDELRLDELQPPLDNSDLDATTSAHGLLPKLSGNANEFLDGDGAWSVPPTADTKELLVADGVTPPEMLTTEDETDFLYED